MDTIYTRGVTILKKYYEDIVYLRKEAYAGFLYKCVHKKTKKKVLLVNQWLGSWSHNFYRKISIWLDVLNDREDISQLYYVHNLEGYFCVACEYTEINLYNINRLKSKIANEKYKRYIIYQILRALHYVHSADVIFGDLNLESVGITADDKIKLDASVPGFLKSDPSANFHRVSQYSAPEQFLWVQKDSSLTPAADMWAMGCILGALYNEENKPPFQGFLEEIFEFVGCPKDSDFKSSVAQLLLNDVPLPPTRRDFKEIFPNIPEDALDLIRKLLQLLPENRITAAEALTHPYISEFHNSMPEIGYPLKFKEDQLDVAQIHSKSNKESYEYMDELIMIKLNKKVFDPIINATILAHNIARSSVALDLLPIEIWTLIFKWLDLPHIRTGEDIAKAVFKIYFGEKERN